MPVGYKRREWLAYLTVSASGPEFSPMLEHGIPSSRPRMAADLRYTTADVDFLESHFRTPNYDTAREEFHRRLRNPTRDQFFRALRDIEAWFAGHRADPDWDGGGLQLCFAGHGCDGDGALVLADGVITPSEFLTSLTNIANNVSRPGRLRLEAVLDSCHSGAFITEVLATCFGQLGDLLIPHNLFASCMDDEFAWEEPGLGHGVFTYCFSVRPPALGALVARTIQPDNTFGPSLTIAGGELGCSLLTIGRQNPVVYRNGAGHLEIGRHSIKLFPDGDRCMSLEEMRTQLRKRRDEVIRVLRPMRMDVSVGGRLSDEDVRRELRDTVQFLKDTAGMSPEEVVKFRLRHAKGDG